MLRPTLCTARDLSVGLTLSLQANTVAKSFANKAVSHVEGGWPKDVDCQEAEHVIRYRKKVRDAQQTCTAWELLYALQAQQVS